MRIFLALNNNIKTMNKKLTVAGQSPHSSPNGAPVKGTPVLKEEQAACSVFLIRGMDCPVEENLVRAKLAGVEGIRSLEFDLLGRRLIVRHVPGALAAVEQALAELDMGAERVMRGGHEDSVNNALRIPWIRLIAAGLIAFLAELSEWLGEEGFHLLGKDACVQLPFGVSGSTLVSLSLSMNAIVLGGLTTYRKGWTSISKFELNINALMFVAVTGAALIGQFSEAAMVMTLFNIAEALEARSLERARHAVRAFTALAPKTAAVLQADGAWKDMDVREVPVGARVRVRPGEKIALDGIVVSGSSTVNQSSITGESMPVEKSGGDTVFAGTLNGTGALEFETTSSAHDCTLARIIQAVEEARAVRSPMQRFADQFARRYTPAIFLLGLAAGLVPPLFWGSHWMESLYNGLTILVVGCPCALVISTPVTIASGLVAAMRSGILVKGGLFLERGRLLTQIALDKTGTLTLGKPRQMDFVSLSDEDENMVRSCAASLATRSDHPVSRALADHAAEMKVPLREVRDFTALPGEGSSGVIEGRKWLLGGRRLVERLQFCSGALERKITELERHGGSVVALAGEKGVRALFAVADTVRESSREALRELRNLGVHTLMLTGDNVHAAEKVARQVGVDGFRANLLPAEKRRVVDALMQGGRRCVGMVGDGINDAPSLACADIGFAMSCGGTDVAIETADVVFMDGDLKKLPRFIRLSRSVYNILVQNVVLILGVKVSVCALALAGNSAMWMAVLADVGLSLIVVANGLRAMRK